MKEILYRRKVARGGGLHSSTRRRLRGAPEEVRGGREERGSAPDLLVPLPVAR